MIIPIVFLLLLSWTLFALWYFIRGLGHKHKKDTWVDYLLFPPVMVIAFIVGHISSWIKKR